MLYLVLVLLQVRSNSNTTLGRIGLGYLYTDFKPQIILDFTCIMGGFGAKIGLFDPDDVS